MAARLAVTQRLEDCDWKGRTPNPTRVIANEVKQSILFSRIRVSLRRMDCRAVCDGSQ